MTNTPITCSVLSRGTLFPAYYGGRNPLGNPVWCGRRTAAKFYTDAEALDADWRALQHELAPEPISIEPLYAPGL